MNIHQSMTLSDSDLNDVDRVILEILSEGRATPGLTQKILADGGEEYSRQYINQRLRRLSEHSHVKNLRGSGVYELANDPRNA